MAPLDELRSRLGADAAEIIGRYPQSRSALLPLLHLVQAEQGYVSADGITFCAEQLGLAEAEVTAVVSFYTMYKREPVGEYHVGVCTNSLCAVMGGDAIFADLKEHLGVGNDETTAGRQGQPGAPGVQRGAATTRPVVMVNWEFFDNMTPRSARDLVDGLRSRRRRRADPRRAAAVHLEAGVADPGRLPRRPGGRRSHRGRPQPGRPAHGQGSRAGRRNTATGRRGKRGAAVTADMPAVTTSVRLTPALTRVLGRAGLVHAGGLPARRRLPGAAQGAGHAAGPGHPDPQGLGAARPRRRRLPHRREVGLHPAGRRQAALPGGQRRRVRAGRLQGHADAADQPAGADRGHRDRLLRDPGAHWPSSTSAARSCT